MVDEAFSIMLVPLGIEQEYYRTLRVESADIHLGDAFHAFFQLLRDKVHQLIFPYTKELPTEIIVDILSRLPAKCIFSLRNISESLYTFTRSPSFLEIYYERATPVITFCYRFTDFPNRLVHHELHVNITDESTKKIIVWELFFPHFWVLKKPIFYGSSLGFLLFVANDVYVYMWNPITRQKFDLQRPYEAYRLCAFYFHPATKAYKLLFRRHEKSIIPSFSFVTIDIISESKREVARSVHHPPNIEKLPTLINQVLHWVVSDANYERVYGGRSDCLNSIILFNTIDECFHTIPHPGEKCGPTRTHDKMGLVELSGSLALCDASFSSDLIIWVLEDYESKEWMKRHVISIEPLIRFCQVKHSNVSHVYVGDFYMFNMELLLRVSNSELVLYHLQKGTMRSVGKCIKKAKTVNLQVLAVTHINTFLHIA